MGCGRLRSLLNLSVTRFEGTGRLASSYLVFDFETTGLDPEHDRIIQVGTCKVMNGAIVECDRWLVDQGVPVPPEATRIHGITRAMTQRGMKPFDSCQRLLDKMAESSICAGHNIHGFDVRFLVAECERHCLPMPDAEHFIDTAAYFKGAQLGLFRSAEETDREYAWRVLSVPAAGVRYNLRHCLHELGIEMDSSQLHDASVDCIATHHVLQAMLASGTIDRL